MFIFVLCFTFIMELKPFFLYDPSIPPWERPLDDEGVLNTKRGMLTKLLASRGVESFDEPLGDYRIVGVATKYLVDITPCEERVLKDWKDTSGEDPREILYSGQLLIFRNGFIPGTGVIGWDLASSGRIHISRPLEYLDDSLRDVVIGTTPSPEHIQSIIEGYRLQEQF